MLNVKKIPLLLIATHRSEQIKTKGGVVVVIWWLDLGFVGFGFDGFPMVVLWWWWLGLFGFD